VRRLHGIEVQIRVGLNSGEVVVRSIGNDLHMDYTAVGRWDRQPTWRQEWSSSRYQVASGSQRRRFAWPRDTCR
jgi:hypothetical protein